MRPCFRTRYLCLALAALLPAACTPATDAIDPEGEAFSAVAADEVITLTGTEPFWGFTIENGMANYANPQHPEGWDFPVVRFAGNNGLGFSGDWDGTAVTITLTPGQCSDGMSDRTFPYVATIALGEETLRGCGYTDRQPFTGDAAP
ncbi:MAG: hypothetical protein NWP98_03105 [Erythrobacter sp.]|nr:hypothetical protein [Erythrobacter sp.]